MSEQENQEQERERPAAGGFASLAMNEIAPSLTKEPSEAPRRSGWLWLVLIVILIGVAVLGYGARRVLNVAPGSEAQKRLKDRVQSLQVWREGVVLGVSYLAGDRLRVDFSPAMGLEPRALRGATIEVMKVFMEERPSRDLFIDGFQGEQQVVWGEYRSKSKLQTAGGGLEPDISVKVAGEPEGGIGQLVKPPVRPR